MATDPSNVRRGHANLDGMAEAEPLGRLQWHNWDQLAIPQIKQAPAGGDSESSNDTVYRPKMEAHEVQDGCCSCAGWLELS